MVSNPWALILGCGIAGWLAVELLAAIAKQTMPIGMNVLGVIAGAFLAFAFVGLSMNDWNETAFMPAEAATEVGADGENRLTAWELIAVWTAFAGSFAISAGLIACVWSLL